MRMDDLHRQSAFAGSEMPLFAAFNSGLTAYRSIVPGLNLTV